jgi:glycosyltransferase involved in cell wall biosynthesis
LDIPYPADYGGVIDIFYKLKNLHKLGIEITLHCFEYGHRFANDMLDKYCHQVIYYPRIRGIKGLHTSLPYIVSSRRNNQLLKNLLADESPILFEGLHTTFYANHPSLSHRKKILRAHNIESDYYKQLAENTNSILKKIYFSFEANRLLFYEKNLASFDAILSISESDFSFFQKEYPSAKHILVNAFHKYDEVISKTGKGNYCLFHGNLSVTENVKSVEYLVKEIFPAIDFPLIIAGKNPTDSLLSLQHEKIKIIANPSEDELENLIQNAHINVLPSFQHTGLKLKLLYALFAGRHCIVDDTQIESTLKNSVHIAKNKSDFIEKIQSLLEKEFSIEEIAIRKKALTSFDNLANARLIENIL